MTISAQTHTTTPPVTRQLVESVRGLRFETLPAEVAAKARHCLLDWLGVALAGAREPLVDILAAHAAEEGGHGQATLLGRGERVTASQAALVNGAASHALDFDDVHIVMSGHPSVPILPALLALAEWQRRHGRDFLAAFVAGFETECRVGAIVGPGHYAVGFHATATLGSFGSAAACAHLLDLDESLWRHTLGIAGTQAAGLKSMFGTMCKPFHAGRAAVNGLSAALLARRGFTSNPDVVETPQGFAATQTTTFAPERATALDTGGFAISDVLFKYHAACFGTHPTIEGALRLRETHHLAPADVERITLRVPPAALTMCNIPEPTTALEGKFSLRFTAALALATGDASEQAFTDARVREPQLTSLRDRVEVQADDAVPGGRTDVAIRLWDGRVIEESVDVNVPEHDVEREWARLTAKFRSLADPVVGAPRAAEIIAAVAAASELEDMGELAALCVPGR